MGVSQADVQRFLFWSNMLGGAAGFTYGAMGIWNMNGKDDPEDNTWGDGFWTDAMHLPGSTHVGIGARLLRRYAWHELRPCAEPALPAGRIAAFSAAIPGRLKIVYLPSNGMPDELLGMMTSPWGTLAPVALDPGASYRVSYVNPITEKTVDGGIAHADAKGLWQPPGKPSYADWVMVMENQG